MYKHLFTCKRLVIYINYLYIFNIYLNVKVYVNAVVQSHKMSKFIYDMDMMGSVSLWVRFFLNIEFLCKQVVIILEEKKT